MANNTNHITEFLKEKSKNLLNCTKHLPILLKQKLIEQATSDSLKIKKYIFYNQDTVFLVIQW